MRKERKKILFLLFIITTMFFTTLIPNESIADNSTQKLVNITLDTDIPFEH